MQLIEFHLDPDHLEFALALEFAHVVDVARKGQHLSVYQQLQVQQTVEERVPEEVADLVDQIPVVVLEVGESGVVALSQHSQMGLRQRGPTQKRLEEYFIVAFRGDGGEQGGSFSLVFECVFEVLECFQLFSFLKLLFAGTAFAGLILAQHFGTCELVIQQHQLLESQSQQGVAFQELFLAHHVALPVELLSPVVD